MGNVVSSSKIEDINATIDDNKNKYTLIEYIDMIATNYILRQSIVDMLRFSDKEYYDNMIVLTSYILKNKLDSLDLSNIKERVINGNNNNNNNNNNNEPIYYSDEKKLKEITFRNEKKKQKALLLISKFYIKIMTLFSAVTATIDPQYVYEDENGEKQFFYLKDFENYSKRLDSKTKKLKINQLDNPIGFVKKRLGILKNKMDSSNNNNGDFVIINPGEKFCENPKSNNESNTLENEIGIKELDALYFDVYDYEENKWNKKSEKMQKKYDEDIKLFYQIFTGKKEKPENIKTFADIEMLDFHNLKRCINRDYYQDLLVSKNDELFILYMEKIDKIQSITKTYKKQLLHVLKQIFIPFEENKETSFIISPKLTMDLLLQYQDDVKKSINKIYMNCERLFIEALVLYEKMYENQYGELTKNQMQDINSKMHSIQNTQNKNIIKSNNLDTNDMYPSLNKPLDESQLLEKTTNVIIPAISEQNKIITPEQSKGPAILSPSLSNTSEQPSTSIFNASITPSNTPPMETPNSLQTPQPSVETSLETNTTQQLEQIPNNISIDSTLPVSQETEITEIPQQPVNASVPLEAPEQPVNASVPLEAPEQPVNASVPLEAPEQPVNAPLEVPEQPVNASVPLEASEQPVNAPPEPAPQEPVNTPPEPAPQEPVNTPIEPAPQETMNAPVEPAAPQETMNASVEPALQETINATTQPAPQEQTITNNTKISNNSQIKIPNSQIASENPIQVGGYQNIAESIKKNIKSMFNS